MTGPLPELVHTPGERAAVQGQLKRPVRGAWRVARRCQLGLPMVIENEPLIDGEPFPTTFWLTCPLLVQRASMLEAAGAMGGLGDDLAADAGLHERFEESVTRYARRRDVRGVIAGPVSPPGGGPDRVKCLHAHVAHELADPPNPVGALVLTRVGWPDCIAPCVPVPPPDVPA